MCNRVKITTILVALCVALGATILSSSDVNASRHKKKKIYTIEQVVKQLKRKRFYNIYVTDKYPPYYDMYACFKGGYFYLTIDHHGNVRRNRDLGECRKRSRR